MGFEGINVLFFYYNCFNFILEIGIGCILSFMKLINFYGW